MRSTSPPPCPSHSSVRPPWPGRPGELDEPTHGTTSREPLDNAAFDPHRPMLRITELRLPLNHADDALRPAIVKRLGIEDADLKDFKVCKRSHDARKKHAMLFIYTVDCELREESAV